MEISHHQRKASRALRRSAKLIVAQPKQIKRTGASAQEHRRPRPARGREYRRTCRGSGCNGRSAGHRRKARLAPRSVHREPPEPAIMKEQLEKHIEKRSEEIDQRQKNRPSRTPRRVLLSNSMRAFAGSMRCCMNSSKPPSKSSVGFSSGCLWISNPLSKTRRTRRTRTTKKIEKFSFVFSLSSVLPNQAIHPSFACIPSPTSPPSGRCEEK